MNKDYEAFVERMNSFSMDFDTNQNDDNPTELAHSKLSELVEESNSKLINLGKKIVARLKREV